MVRFSFIFKYYYHSVAEHQNLHSLGTYVPLVILHPYFWHIKVFVALSAGKIIKQRIDGSWFMNVIIWTEIELLEPCYGAANGDLFEQ